MHRKGKSNKRTSRFVLKKHLNVKNSTLALCLFFVLSQAIFIFSETAAGTSANSQNEADNNYASAQALQEDNPKEAAITVPYQYITQKDREQLITYSGETATGTEGALTMMASADIAQVQDTADAAAQPQATPEPTPTPTPAPVYVAETESTKYVNANELNVRENPGAEYEKLSSVERGDKVTYFGKIGDWAKIKTTAGNIGYVLLSYLVDSEKNVVKPVTVAKATVSRSASSAASLSTEGLTLAQKVVAYAKTLQGVKYVYGGYSKSGFDCSGFTKYVYDNFNISVPRSSASYSSLSGSVSRSDLQPGDVLLFDTDGGSVNVSHVGIYIGNDQFIHASSTKGKVVVASFSGYQGKYLGARRVLK